MRDVIIGAVLVSVAGLGVYFFDGDAAEAPSKVYSLDRKKAVYRLDRTEDLLNRLDFAGYRLYNVMSGGGLVEFIDKSNGHDVICSAQVEEVEGGVTVKGSCLDDRVDTPAALAKKQVADLTMREFLDSVLDVRPFNQVTVLQGIDQLDTSKLSVEELVGLKAQAKIGDPPPYRPPNGQSAKDSIASDYNAEGEGGTDDWSTEAVVH